MHENKYTTRIEWFGWTCTVLAIGFVVYTNIAQKKVVKENNTYKPDSQSIDMIMDSIDMNCGDSL